MHVKFWLNHFCDLTFFVLFSVCFDTCDPSALQRSLIRIFWVSLLSKV